MSNERPDNAPPKRDTRPAPSESLKGAGKLTRGKGGESKHRMVAAALRRKIVEGVWVQGGRIPSEQLIADTFGVAYMTARQAVTSLVAEGLLERIPRKGTFVAKTPAAAARPTLRNEFVLLFQGGRASLDPYYLPPIVAAFEQEIQSQGFEVAVYDYSTAILDGLIPKESPICCVLLSEPEILYANLLRERGNRVYAINRCKPGGFVPFIAPDNVGGAEAAVNHLLDLGHRRIGLIRGMAGNIDATDRRQGYVQALRNRDLSPGPEYGDSFNEAGGYKAAREMIAAGEIPTAVFCASDLSAIGAMKAFAECGLTVPGDISFVGFGDFPLAKFMHPGLTTVRLPLAELGLGAAREIVKIAQGDQAADRYLPCDLVVRESTSTVPPLEWNEPARATR